MKNIYKITAKSVFILILLIMYKPATAQCNGGTISVSTNLCPLNLVTLHLVGHSTGTGVTYQWYSSNDLGVSWTPIAGATADTLNISPSLVRRMYQCSVICPTGVATSSQFSFNYINRSLTVTGKICSPTGTNDSITIALSSNPAVSVDSLCAKYILWQGTSTSGGIWNNVATNKTSINVKFMPKNPVTYRAIVSICPLIFPPLPNTPPQVTTNNITAGVQNDKIGVSNKNCPKDSARLSMATVDPTLKNFLIISWLESTSKTGPYTIIGNDTGVDVKVTNVNKYYKASIKLCPNSKDSAESEVYSLITKIGATTVSLNCDSNRVSIDYANRLEKANSTFTTWTISPNDSLSHAPLSGPTDSTIYSFILNNYTDNYYKIYSKFCNTSTTILDSTYNIRVMLIVDTGQLLANYQLCQKDSVQLTVKNFKAKSTFPIYNLWEYSKDGNNYDSITIPLSIDTSAVVKTKPGYSYYRKSVRFCNDKFAKTLNSSVAKIYQPDLLYCSPFNCSGNNIFKVYNDSPSITDYTGVKFRPAPFSYRWLLTTDEGLTFTVVPGATLDSLVIPSTCGGTYKYVRESYPCSSSGVADRTRLSYASIPFTGSMPKNGRTVTLDDVCLNDSVTISVVDTLPVSGTTCVVYSWQYSTDNVNWIEIGVSSATMRAMVTNSYQYFRRVTKYCPSGQYTYSNPMTLYYNQPLPYCEGFDNQLLFGSNVLYNCWRFMGATTNFCVPTSNPVIWSNPSGGKTKTGYQHQKPNSPPANIAADGKLVTPAFRLKKGHIYRLSFWHKENSGNLCWDQLYTTWGHTPSSCKIENGFGDTVRNFNFDQWNRFWSDFVAPIDSVYYFGIVYKEATPSTGDIAFDDICITEIERCDVEPNITKGRVVAPNKEIDRNEYPGVIAQNYNKDRVRHQYCIGDTIMLTYDENNYTSKFDYYGMKYQYFKLVKDEDWHVNDTFYKPIPFYTWDSCHINQNSLYQTMNVVATDTHTFYKIVATCTFNGKTFTADSLLVNGTHSLPYCEDWRGAGSPINEGDANFTHVLPNKNSSGIRITGKGPRYGLCPTCWASFNQDIVPTSNFYSVSLPFNNPNNAVPQLWPDGGYVDNNVVMNYDVGNPSLTRKILVFPAVRMYKNRGYRISFRWTDNRQNLQSPYGNISQKTDSLFLIIRDSVHFNILNYDTFKNVIYNKQIQRNAQSNYLESPSAAKYKTYWYDFSPKDTGTYYIGIAQVSNAGNGNPYRFYMDYFCIDTLPMDVCYPKPEFINPLRVRISPDGVSWFPGDTSVIPGIQWCVGNEVCLELDWGQGTVNNWHYGWKHIWQVDTVNPVSGNLPSWKSVDSSNRVCYVLSYKYRNYRILLKNICGDSAIVGPFGVAAPGGNLPWREGFEKYSFMPPCWERIAEPRIGVKNSPNMFGFSGKCSNNYLETDYFTGNQSGNPFRTSNTVIPPGFGVVPGVTYRFSFWYMDNGLSQTYDSIKVGWSYSRPTENFPAANTLVNKVTNSIVKNSKEGKWRYYTAEYVSTTDSAVNFKVRSYVNPALATYFLLYDDFCFKPKYNNDALVIAIDSPVKTCNLNANSTLKIKVMNIGSVTQPNIPIQYSINGSSPVSAVVPGPVPSNGVVTYNLTGVDMTPLGPISVLVWTNLSNDQDRRDDTFCTTIIHDEIFNQPTDTGTSICKYKNLEYVVNTPNTFARWYRKLSDTIPFQIGDTIRIDSFQTDTCFYVAASNSAVCYTSPYTYSQGISAYSNASDGLIFNNTSKDTLVIDSLTLYSSNVGNYTITLSQYGSTVAGNLPLTGSFTTSGKHVIKVGWKIPPGTDYRILYTGTLSLAYLKNYIFLSVGCPNFNFEVTGGIVAPGNKYNYFFNMKLISPGCESARTKVCFTKVDNPVFNLKDTNRVCQLPQYNVCGPTAPTGQTYTYQWNINNSTSACVPAVNSGSYNLTVTNQFGCTYKDSLDIIVDPSPIFDLGANQTFCRLSPYTIKTGLDSNSNTVVWNNGGAGVNLKVWNPGTYIATAYNTTNFCVAKDTITLTRLELPVFSLGNDRVVCANSIDLGTSLTNSSLSYTWDNGSTTKSRVVTSSGTYWVKGTDPNTGCSAYDTVTVNLKPTPAINLGPDTLKVCGTTTTLTAPAGNYNYLWNTTATTSSISVSSPGKYYLTVTNPVNGCSSTDSVLVSFYTYPVFDLGPTIKKCTSTSYSLTSPISGSGFTYNWLLPDGTTQSTSTISVTKSGTYYLTVNNGCYSYKDSVRVVLNGSTVGQIDLLPDSIRACNATTLTATSSPTSGNIYWGNPLNLTTNSVVVSATGSYPVSLTNECGSTTKTCFVTIDQIPVADFKVDTPSSMSVGLTNLSSYAQNTYWNFGDDSTSTETNPVHIYNQEGSYVITLQVTNSCGTRYKSINIPRRYKKTSNGSSGIAGLNLNDAEIILYPNPTGNKTQLYGKGMPNGTYNISVINTLGQVVLNDKVKVHNATLDVTFDANSFANGEYMVKIESDNETVIKKLIVTK